MNRYNLVIIFSICLFLFGCAPVRTVGDPIGSGIGELSDELGGEKKLGKEGDEIIIHPEADKKIKMDF